MLERMSGETLKRWMEFSEISPFLRTRVEHALAIQGAQIVASLTGRRQRLADFMPRHKTSETERLRQMENTMEQFAAAMGQYLGE